MAQRIGLAGFCLALLMSYVPAEAQDLPKPGPEHKILAQEEGPWDASVKAFMGGPDAPPAVSKGTEVNTLMTGGFWLVSKFNGDFGGLPFEGRGQFGYDSIKKKYVGTWVDSMSPTLSVLEGTYDAKTKTMTYVGDGVDVTSKKKFTQKMVTKTNDDGTRVFSLYMKMEGDDKETKFMEITYTKQK